MWDYLFKLIIHILFEKALCSQYWVCKPPQGLVCMFNIQPTAAVDKSLHESPKCLLLLASSKRQFTLSLYVGYF